MKWLKNKDILKNITILLLVVVFVLVYWRMDGEDRLKNFAIGNSTMNSKEFLAIFEIDSKEACKEKDRNKYNIPEDECIARINRNSHACKIKVIEKFTGKVNSIDKMLLIGNSFTSCVFSDKEE